MCTIPLNGSLLVWTVAQCAATSENMQIEKAPANQENIFINLTAGAANAHNTNK